MQNNGQIVLRVEDTDQSRKVEGAVGKLLAAFEQVGLKFDEGPEQGGVNGPYFQSQRLDIYKKHVQQLVEIGLAYPCFCSSERLDKLREEKQSANESTQYDRSCLGLSSKEIEENLASIPHVYRLKVPNDQIVEFTDLVRGIIKFNTEEIDDQVLLKSDGYPTYHLANVVDDYHMKISHVIRGEEWLPSTPKHVLLYRAFDWDLPQFAHVPLLLNPDKSKLSKRQGDVAVEDYLSRGILPETLINFIALLGWNPGTDEEIFTLDELVKAFSLERIQKGGAVFDQEKLFWMNGVYLRDLSLERIIEAATPCFLASELDISDTEKFARVIDFARKRVTLIPELVDEAKYFYQRLYTNQPERALIEEGASINLYTYWFHQLTEKNMWTDEEIKDLVKQSSVKTGLKGKDLFFPLRLALYGQCKGPDIPSIYNILGRDEMISRLKNLL